MTFGRVHLGKSFEELWTSNPSWIKWFLAHDASSGKTEYRKMIRFTQLKIEESETECPQPSAKSLPKAMATRPKAKAAPVIHLDGPEEEEEFDHLERMSESPWLAPSAKQEEIHALQERMLNLEGAMQRMIAMMQNVMPMTRQTPVATPELDTAVWDDPWNN